MPGPVKGERGVLIRVQTKEARDSVQILCSGDRLGGYPVHVYLGTVTAPAACGISTHCPLHCGAGSIMATGRRRRGFRGFPWSRRSFRGA